MIRSTEYRAVLLLLVEVVLSVSMIEVMTVTGAGTLTVAAGVGAGVALDAALTVALETAATVAAGVDAAVVVSAAKAAQHKRKVDTCRRAYTACSQQWVVASAAQPEMMRCFSLCVRCQHAYGLAKSRQNDCNNHSARQLTLNIPNCICYMHDWQCDSMQCTVSLDAVLTSPWPTTYWPVRGMGPQTARTAKSSPQVQALLDNMFCNKYLYLAVPAAQYKKGSDEWLSLLNAQVQWTEQPALSDGSSDFVFWTGYATVGHAGLHNYGTDRFPESLSWDTCLCCIDFANT